MEDLVNPKYFPWHMPLEFRELIMSWPIRVKSPHSHSYYDTNEKTWDNNPLNSHRISDHWNFTSRGAIHCPTDRLPNSNCWQLAQWDGQVYNIIEEIRKRPLRTLTDEEANRLSPRLQRKRDASIAKMVERGGFEPPRT